MLDPHFCENCETSPIARFEPTARGWDMGLTLIYVEHSKAHSSDHELLELIYEHFEFNFVECSDEDEQYLRCIYCGSSKRNGTSDDIFHKDDCLFQQLKKQLEKE
jgi:hypothetical protein